VVGGGHNDMLMMALMIAGVALALTERERLGASAVVAAAAVKASAVAVLPFMALGATRRRTAMVGAMLGFAVCALVAVLAFGKDGWTFLAVLEKQQRLVATDSFPDMVAQLLGLPGVAAGVRFAAYLALGACGLALSAAVWRGADWVTASGWMLLTLAVTTTFLVPWYTVWALPFAAISGSRRLLVATLAVEALYFAHQLAPLFA
jgi:alpha-1,6-mannosyltransferase